MSLPRRRILRKRAHFLRVRSLGQAKPGRYLLVTAVPNDAPGAPSQFGFITPRYVGKAHDRNLVRRRLRAIVREDENLLKSGLHVVVLARRTVAQAGFNALRTEWRKLAGRAGVFLSPAAPSPTSHPQSPPN